MSINKYRAIDAQETKYWRRERERREAIETAILDDRVRLVKPKK